jgi:mRNA-degrading endonuclease RelE of RelBE toxin-antitoxin system
MNWAIRLSAAAIKELRLLPRDRQARVEHAIDQMETDPLAGDVKPLKGPEWKGRYRKRIGPYRIVFTMDRRAMSVEISRILIRSEKTYR